MGSNNVILSGETLEKVDCFNTLMGHTVGRCDLPERAGRFSPDINVYAISNFLTSSLVLDIFFWYEIVRKLNSL